MCTGGECGVDGSEECAKMESGRMRERSVQRWRVWYGQREEFAQIEWCRGVRSVHR